MNQFVVGHRSFVEGRLAGQQEVKSGTQAVNIGSNVGLIAVDDLLGGQIIFGPQNALTLRFAASGFNSFVEKVRQTHVQHLHHPLAIQKQVSGLDVSMDEASLVGML